MKPMKDRAIGMGAGMPKSAPFFPEQPHRKMLPRAGDMKAMKYPDTEEAIHADQNQGVAAVNRSAPKPEFRH